MRIAFVLEEIQPITLFYDRKKVPGSKFLPANARQIEALQRISLPKQANTLQTRPARHDQQLLGTRCRTEQALLTDRSARIQNINGIAGTRGGRDQICRCRF